MKTCKAILFRKNVVNGSRFWKKRTKCVFEAGHTGMHFGYPHPWYDPGARHAISHFRKGVIW